MNRKISPGVIQAQSGGVTAGVGLLSGWGVITLQKSRRWDGLQERRDGRRKEISVKKNPKRLADLDQVALPTAACGDILDRSHFHTLG